MGTMKRTVTRLWSISIHSAVAVMLITILLTYIAPSLLLNEPKAYARQVGKCMNDTWKHCCDLVTIPCIYVCSPDPCCAQITRNAIRRHVFTVTLGNPPSDYSPYRNQGCVYKEPIGCGSPCPVAENETTMGCTDYDYYFSWESCP